MDDLDGSTGDRTLTFTWDGTAYEIELSKKNAAALEKSMKPYVEAARKVKAARVRRASSTRGSKRDLAAIREWAQQNGFEVSARGRVATAVIDAYDAANG